MKILKKYSLFVFISVFLLAPTASAEELVPFQRFELPVKEFQEFNWFQESQGIPVANAGDDQNVLKGTTVVLNGQKSQFQDGDIFEWTLTDGPVSEVVFDMADITRPSFVPPVDGVYRLTLRITSKDSIESDADGVVVSVGENYQSPKHIFDDVPSDHANITAIEYLFRTGVIHGNISADGNSRNFMPNELITRSQILKVFFLGSNITVPENTEIKLPFVDTDSRAWYGKYLSYAIDKQIVKGTTTASGASYFPERPVNRAEALKILLAINNYDSSTSESIPPFVDVPTDAWFFPYMTVAKKLNLLDPDPDGKIFPDKVVTRAETAELMYRAIKAGIVGSRGTLSGFVYRLDGKLPVSGAKLSLFRSTDGKKQDSVFTTLVTDSEGKFELGLPTGEFIVEVMGDNTSDQKSFTVDIVNQRTTSVTFDL